MMRCLIYMSFALVLLSRVAVAFGSEPSQESFGEVSVQREENYALRGLLHWKAQLSVLAEDPSVPHLEASKNKLYLKLKSIEDLLLIRQRVEKEVDWDFLYELLSEYDESDPLHWYLFYYHGLHLFATGQLKEAEVMLNKAYEWASIHTVFAYQRSSLLALYEVNMCANKSSEAVHYFRLFYELNEHHRNENVVEVRSDSSKALIHASSTEISPYKWWWWMVILMLGILLWYGWTKYRLVLVPVHHASNSKHTSYPFKQSSNAPFGSGRRTGDEVLTDEEILVDEQKVELLAELRSKKILTEEDWIVFERLFLQVHPDFLVRLRFRHKQITPSEEKLACFIRLHFSTKEIARLLAVSTHAVNVGRYRLKKRFALEGSQRLEEYLMGF